MLLRDYIWQTLELTCPACYTSYVVGENAGIVSDEDIFSKLVFSTVTMSGNVTYEPELVKRCIVEIQQKFEFSESLKHIKYDLMKGKGRKWQCDNCKAVNYYDLLSNWKETKIDLFKTGIPSTFELLASGKVAYDPSTELMWQQSVSPDILYYDEAEEYIAQLNQEKFAGFDDWRLPILDEALTLDREGGSPVLKIGDISYKIPMNSMLENNRTTIWSSIYAEIEPFRAWYKRLLLNLWPNIRFLLDRDITLESVWYERVLHWIWPDGLEETSYRAYAVILYHYYECTIRDCDIAMDHRYHVRAVRGVMTSMI